MKTYKEHEFIRHNIIRRRREYERKRLFYKKPSVVPNEPRNEKEPKSEVVDIVRNYVGVGEKVRRKRDIVNVHIPRNFSIIDSPNEALKCIYKMVKYACQYKSIGTFFIWHDKMQSYDLGAEILFDCFFSEVKKNHKKAKAEGAYPDDKMAMRFIKSVGIIDELGIDHERLSQQELEKIEIFKRKSRKIPSLVDGVGRSIFEDVTQSFAKHINMCLRHINKQLTDDSCARLSQYVSEILDNIGEHSGMDNWRIAGFLDTKDSTKSCELVIFNFGRTIADTLLSLNEENIMREKLRRYIKLHNNRFDDDTLATIYALQGAISSKNTSEITTRGQGTVELINFFNGLCKELHCDDGGCYRDKMIVMSGLVHITIDSTCKMFKVDGDRSIIPFNESGSLKEPPQERYIKRLQHFFPGTLISIRFNLPNSMLTKVSQ